MGNIFLLYGTFSDGLFSNGTFSDGIFSRVGHSVLLRSERYVLLSSKKRTLRSFPFFS